MIAKLSYEDWHDFFTKRLTNSGAFQLSETFSVNSTEIEIYSALKGNLDTRIELGYLSPTLLVYLQIINPATPANNKQQQIEHFYKYDFDQRKQFGPPGLEFNEVNIQGINSYLEQGFNGSETIYYRNGTPIKSTLTTRYYSDSPETTVAYYFQKKSIFVRLLNILFGRHTEYDEVKTVNLQEIFGGV